MCGFGVAVAMLVSGVACHAGETSDARQGGAAVRVEVRSCEVWAERCSAWTFDGLRGTGLGEHGEVEKLTITAVDQKIKVHRVDVTGPTKGFSADYEADASDDGKLLGRMVSNWPGHWKDHPDNWGAAFPPGGIPALAVAAMPAGAPDVAIDGAWSDGSADPPELISVDAHRGVRWVIPGTSGERDEILQGRYLTMDRVEFVANHVEPQGCRWATYFHWQAVDPNQVVVTMDPAHACGKDTEGFQSSLTKLKSMPPRRSPEDEALDRILGGLAAVAGSGEQPPCAGHVDGHCATQSQMDAYEAEQSIRRGAQGAAGR